MQDLMKARPRGKGRPQQKKKQPVFSAVPEQTTLNFLDSTKDQAYFLEVR